MIEVKTNEMDKVVTYDGIVKPYNTRKDVVFLLILLLAFTLRLYLASVSTYVWDEDRDWIPLVESISFQSGNLNLPIRGEHHGALAAYFMKAGRMLLGDNPIGFRFFNLLAGMFTLILAYKLALAWFGPIAARWTAVLLAFNEYHIAISFIAIQKSFYLFFVMLAVYAFSRFYHTERPKYLYLMAGAAGLAFLCYAIAALLIPVLILAFILSKYRSWLRRREPYIAALVFLAIIAPDLYWNVMRPTTEGVQATYGDQLAGFVGFGLAKGYGIVPQPFLFYGREAARAVANIAGKGFFDPLREWPATNVVFGAILFGGVLVSTFRDKQKCFFTKFLLALFWVVFGFFVLLKPGARRYGDDTAWHWVDMSLLPAAILTGRCFSTLREKWRLPLFATFTAAALYAVFGIFALHLGLPSRTLGFSPEVIRPPDGRMVEVQAKFIQCALCDSNPRIQLLDIRVHDKNKSVSGVNTSDVEGADLGVDDHQFRLRAALDSLNPSRHYEIIYQVTDASGNAEIVKSALPVWEGDRALPPLPFWIR